MARPSTGSSHLDTVKTVPECTCADWPSDDLHVDSAPKGGCGVHVDCDDRCRALRDPQTIEEYRAALDHWVNHGWWSGCAHGQ